VPTAAPVVNEQLLEAIIPPAESSILKAQLRIGKGIDIIRRVTSSHTVGDVTEALYVSHITSQHSIERPASLEVAPRRTAQC